MLSQQTLYPEGFTFISPPASPSNIITPATVQEQMGNYYPHTAQCTVQTFETQGWTGCLAASTIGPRSGRASRTPRRLAAPGHLYWATTQGRYSGPLRPRAVSSSRARGRRSRRTRQCGRIR